MTRGGASASISQEAAVQGAASLERRLKPREQRVQAVHCPAVEMPRKEGGGGVRGELLRARGRMGCLVLKRQRHTAG